MSSDAKYYVKDLYGVDKKAGTVKAVYESFNGWYWVLVKVPKNPNKPYAIGYGFVKGLESEWGSVYMSDLLNDKMIWPVPVDSWTSTGLVVKA